MILLIALESNRLIALCRRSDLSEEPGSSGKVSVTLSYHLQSEDLSTEEPRSSDKVYY